MTLPSPLPRPAAGCLPCACWLLVLQLHPQHHPCSSPLPRPALQFCNSAVDPPVCADIIQPAPITVGGGTGTIFRIPGSGTGTLPLDASASACAGGTCSSYSWELVNCTNAPNAGPFPKALGSGPKLNVTVGPGAAGINTANATSPVITCQISLTITATDNGVGERAAAAKATRQGASFRHHAASSKGRRQRGAQTAASVRGHDQPWPTSGPPRTCPGQLLAHSPLPHLSTLTSRVTQAGAGAASLTPFPRRPTETLRCTGQSLALCRRGIYAMAAAAAQLAQDPARCSKARLVY